MNTCRSSATPSPSASRSSVMRLALGTPAPARFWTMPMTFDLIARDEAAAAVVGCPRAWAACCSRPPARRRWAGCRPSAGGPGRGPARSPRSLRAGRARGVGPADGRGDVDGGHQGLVRRRQLRRRTDAGIDRQLGGVAAAGQQQRSASGQARAGGEGASWWMSFGAEPTARIDHGDPAPPPVSAVGAFGCGRPAPGAAATIGR